MSRVAARRRGEPADSARLTDEEIAALLEHGGRHLLGWARRVKLEADALERLLRGEPERSRMLPFGRRASASWEG